MQVRLTNVSYTGTSLYKVWFIQDSILMRVHVSKGFTIPTNTKLRQYGMTAKYLVY